MAIKFNPDQTYGTFETNALVGIPEEVTALGIARKHQKEKEWQTALAQWKKGNGYRKSGTSLVDLLTDVCTRRDNLVRYDGFPQVYDYDEKHLLVEGISSVDVEDRVIESYPRLLVMKDVFLDGNGGIRYFTTYQAIKHCEQEECFLLSSQAACALIAALFQNKNKPEANKVLMQYKDRGNGIGWHALNTLADYEKSSLISYPNDSDFPSSAGGIDKINQSRQRIELPFEKTRKKFLGTKILESMDLEEGLKDELMSRFVRQYSGLPEPSVLAEIGKYFGKPAYVLVSSSNVIQTAWLGCYSDDFILNTNYDLNSYNAARGVKLVAP